MNLFHILFHDLFCLGKFVERSSNRIGYKKLFCIQCGTVCYKRSKLSEKAN